MSIHPGYGKPVAVTPQVTKNVALEPDGKLGLISTPETRFEKGKLAAGHMFATVELHVTVVQLSPGLKISLKVAPAAPSGPAFEATTV